MNKNFQRLYKSYVIILALILFLPITKLSAHEVTNSPWLFINDTPITEDMENTVPNTSKLQWAEHVFPNRMNVGDKITTRIDKSILASTLEVEEANISIEYTLKKSINDSETYLEDFSKTFSSTGNYFLDIYVKRKDDKKEIVSESVMVVVGEVITPSKFTVNNETIDISLVIPTYIVLDNYNIKFAINNPDNNKYNYTWDFGTGETKEGTAVEYNFDKAKLPSFVILRTTDISTNVFADSFVRIDSKSQNNFTTPRPPVKIPSTTNLELADENNSIKVVIGVVSVILILTAIFITYKNRE